MICNGCDYKKNAPEGICSVLKGSDGLPVRCVGLWAKDKVAKKRDRYIISWSEVGD